MLLCLSLPAAGHQSTGRVKGRDEDLHKGRRPDEVLGQRPENGEDGWTPIPENTEDPHPLGYSQQPQT